MQKRYISPIGWVVQADSLHLEIGRSKKSDFGPKAIGASGGERGKRLGGEREFRGL